MQLVSLYTNDKTHLASIYMVLGFYVIIEDVSDETLKYFINAM